MRRLPCLLLVLGAGCTIAGESAPRLMGGPALAALTVRISARDRQIAAEGPGTLRSVEMSGATATIRLTGGQVLTATFDAARSLFRVEVLEDADSSVDVGIGRTTVHATRGDVFEARVIDAHLDVVVRRGLVIVVGPDERRAELAQGNQLTVSGGAEGAILGAAGRESEPRKPRGLPREPRRATILDRTDIAPAP